MELVLTKNGQNQVTVTCDGQPSHTFSLTDLLPQRQDDPLVLTNPVETGARLFAALFADGSPAHAAWTRHPKRILLVAEDPALDAIPWEYLRGPDGFVVLDAAFVRGFPAAKRQPAPDLTGISLHIVAIPSNPIGHDIARLDIAGEWTRLKESLNGLETAIRLERARPPTLEQARRLVANQRQRVVHFMGHGGHNGSDSFLLFENEQGGPKNITAQEFIRRMEDSAFLVTLNACVSATPGATEFSNLARALTERGVPYALGMRFSIPDADAKAFSQTFYSELARGSSVENALRQARNSLADSKNPWAVGTPVLYTSLNDAAKGFETPPGAPRIDEHQPPLEVSVLPRAEGAFQGRVDELLALGQALTGEPRAKLLTIHGPGGQGKTALAREAAERFAHAWPGGVWAVSLEHNAALDRFTLELARLFKIDLDGIYKQVASAHPNLETDVFQQYVQQELECRILALLNNQRALLVLDNAETFVEAVDAKDKAALDLAVFLREKVLSTQASLLLTSRNHLGWTGEQALELAGLSNEEGARLFWQSAPGRSLDAIGPLAQEISCKVEGHPLSLRLLGGAFDASAISLETFVREVENTLLQAEDKYKHEDHRHRTLYASIETSVRYLDETERALLSGLWIFKSPFLVETAGQIFVRPDLPETKIKIQQDQIAERLHTLFQHGLLARDVETLSDGKLLLYRGLPTIRLFAKHYLEQAQSVENLQAQMSKVYAVLLQNIHSQRDSYDWAAFLALRCREDLETCSGWVGRDEQGWYANRLGFVLQRIGDWQAGLRWLEQALELGQGTDQDLELDILNNMALVYSDTGQPGKALELFEQALLILRAVGDRAREANTLNNMASVYRHTGQPGKALELCEQGLPLMKAVGNQAGEAATLNNMALVYCATGLSGKALALFEQILPIVRTIGNKANEATILNNMGERYRVMGQPSKALEFFRQALPIAREMGKRESEAAIINNMAALHQNIGQMAHALELFEQALPLMRTVGDRNGETSTLNNMALVCHNIGQSGKALELYAQCLHIRREVGDRAGEATTLSNIGEVYRATGNSGKALELFEQALLIAHEVSDRVGEATTLNNMGMVYSDSNPRKALELYGQALSIVRELGDRVDEATTLNNVASVYYKTGNPGKALELYELILPIQREFGNQEMEAITLNNLGEVHRNTGNLAKALEFYEQALPILRAMGNREDESITLNNMAFVYQNTAQLDKALELYEQVLQLLRAIGDRLHEATTLNNIGLLYQLMGKIDDAMSIYEQVLIINREIKDSAGEAQSLNNMGVVYQSSGKTEIALKLYEQALPIFRAMGNRLGESAIYNNMGKICYSNREMNKALQFYEQALLLNNEMDEKPTASAIMYNMAMLFKDTSCSEDAITMLEQAIIILQQAGLRQSPSGVTIEKMQTVLDEMKLGKE
jgi:tetratricopeptide (TPR) repeat protein